MALTSKAPTTWVYLRRSEVRFRASLRKDSKGWPYPNSTQQSLKSHESALSMSNCNPMVPSFPKSLLSAKDLQSRLAQTLLWVKMRCNRRLYLDQITLRSSRSLIEASLTLILLFQTEHLEPSTILRRTRKISRLKS